MPNHRKRIGKAAAAGMALLLMMQPVLLDAASIETLKEQKDETIEQQKKHQQQLHQLQEHMATLKEKKDDVQAEIKEYDRRMTIVSERLYELEQGIKQQKNKLKDTEEQINRQSEAMESYQSYFSERARAMYQSDAVKGGIAPLIKLLLQSESFGAFISHLVQQQKILHYDDEMYQNYVTTNETLKKEKARKKEDLTKLHEKQDTLHLLTQRYESLHQERQAYMKNLVADMSQTAVNQNQTQEDINNTEQQAIQLEKQIQQREHKASKAVKSMNAEAPFITPVNNGYISSNFGRRWGEMHYGTDYGVTIRTSVKAAAAGTVQRASYMNGYGNTVILRHQINGQTYETLYAHLSHDTVEEGQKVKKGEEIAKSGNSGHSMGPHLHFETHIGTWNGQKSNAVDPQTFFN